jgi:integrase
MAGGRVLRACKPGGKELVTPNKIAALMRAVVAKLGIPRARPHDLRRTASTLIQSAVLPDRPKYLLEEVGWLLSHRSQDKNGVTGIYGRYEHFEEKRAIATVLGPRVDADTWDRDRDVGEARGLIHERGLSEGGRTAPFFFP